MHRRVTTWSDISEPSPPPPPPPVEAKHLKGRSSCLPVISLMDPAESLAHESSKLILFVIGYKEPPITGRHACKRTQRNLSKHPARLSFLDEKHWHFHLQSSLPSKTRQHSRGIYKYSCLFSGLEITSDQCTDSQGHLLDLVIMLAKCLRFIHSKDQKMQNNLLGSLNYTSPFLNKEHGAQRWGESSRARKRKRI